MQLHTNAGEEGPPITAFKNLTKKNYCNFCLSLKAKIFYLFFLTAQKKSFEIDFFIHRIHVFTTSMRATTIAVKPDIFMGTSCNFE